MAKTDSTNQTRSSRVPTEPWQVTKKHVYLTTEEIACMGDTEDHGEQTDLKVRKRFGTQPWMNTKYITNNFENRHNAQQKILKEQQKQLKEQQRIIEELKYAQNQTKLQEQLEKQQAILEHLAKNITPRVAGDQSTESGGSSSPSVPRQHSDRQSSVSKLSKMSRPATAGPQHKSQNDVGSMKNKTNNNATPDTARTTSTGVTTARTDSTNKSNTRYLQMIKSKLKDHLHQLLLHY